jgi:subtilisin family serine protease
VFFFGNGELKRRRTLSGGHVNPSRPIAAIALLSLFAVSSAAVGAPSDGPASLPGQDTTSAIVQLKGDPLSTSAKTKPPKGKKIDFNSATVKSYRATLSALRNDFKAWLRTNAPGAKVTGEFDISLNAVSVSLGGEQLATIAAAPMVQRAEYEGLYYPTATAVADPDLKIIGIDSRSAAHASAGDGVKVAIIDTGIDLTHPCFSDAGYPNQTQIGDPRFTNNKVIAAKVFNNKTPSSGFTAKAIQAHGTHVAGTVACNLDTTATVAGVSIPYALSGVAPRALLGNYNVFPDNVGNARSEDILNAMEAAYADGFDVGNMSLGGGSHGFQDLLTIGVDNLDQANMVFAVAAGNSGPGHFTVESPGSAARALAAGASTVPHFIGTPVTVTGKPSIGAATGDFATVTADLTTPLAVVLSGTSLSTACSALAAGSLTGKIALISRGTCSFSAKIRNAQNAGAAAVLMVNNVGGTPIAMGQDGTPNQPTIPAYMVALSDRAALMASDGLATTISAAKQYFLSSDANADIMAGFSSQGPTDVDFRVKPDVVAPGVNVLSSIPRSFCNGEPCFAFFQGTSMATPHLAGSAAVVVQKHPDWTGAMVRSAIVNTADQGVLKNFQGRALQHDVNVIGSGRENVSAALLATVALDPVSVSFGAVPSGSGQTRSFALTVTNVGAPATFSFGVADVVSNGVSFAVEPSTLSIGTSESGTVVVTAAADKGAPAGDNQATLSVSKGGVEVAHAAVYTLVK